MESVEVVAWVRASAQGRLADSATSATVVGASASARCGGSFGSVSFGWLLFGCSRRVLRASAFTVLGEREKSRFAAECLARGVMEAIGGCRIKRKWGRICPTSPLRLGGQDAPPCFYSIARKPRAIVRGSCSVGRDRIF
ncbi:hypothetical protein [Prevotella intermedia]|uniref:hypothetical protein n=1 Tax=Prevotella intermedia TaxID=28131 RepID=UPI0011846B97|nr:hypothetical protein [Prevotella intermedia]